MKKTIVLFDGDTLAYRFSSGIDNRSIIAKHVLSGNSLEFKNKTELKDYLQEQDKLDEIDDWSIEQQQNPFPTQRAYDGMDKCILDVMSNLFADEYLVFLSGKTNFRDELPLPVKYKGNRADLVRPVHLVKCKTHLWKKHPSEIATHNEADDLLIYRGYQYLAEGYDVILASQDKDAYAYSGLSLYDFTKEVPTLERIPEGLGWLKDTGKKITGRGFIWYAFQVLNGDSTDNFKPTDLISKSFGAKSVYKYLKDVKNEQEAIDKILNKYKEWFGDSFEYIDWKGNNIKTNYLGILKMYHKACRMQATPNDDLDVIEFYKNYGVNIDDKGFIHGT